VANKSGQFEWLKFTLEGVGERYHGYAFEDTAFDDIVSERYSTHATPANPQW